MTHSRAAGFSAGDTVAGSGPWRRRFAAPAAGFRKIVGGTEAVPISAHLGVIGGTGLSAYLPIKHIGQPQPGETVFVSGAAGAVGSVACQICRIMGCKVVGSAGTPEKVEWLRSLGVAAFNYKTGSLSASLASLCPDGIDVYFDNVGGEMLDAALELMNTDGRIIACGGISGYNAADKSQIYGLKNYMAIVRSQLRYQVRNPLRFPPRAVHGYSIVCVWGSYMGNSTGIHRHEMASGVPAGAGAAAALDGGWRDRPRGDGDGGL